MPLKGFFRGLDDSSSESGSSHSGGAGGRRESALGKVARVLLPNANRRDRGSAAPYFNPEEHISQKREWSRRYTQQEGGAGGGEGREDRLYEHFAVVGLPPNMNIREVAADIKTYQRLNRAAGSGGSVAAAAGGLEVTADTPREERQRQYGLKGPALQAEVLHTLPSAPAMAPDLAQSLAAFCFPHGVRPELLERTPSMSALNEVIYSQPYQTHDDQSFVFLMKVTDPGSVAPRTLYGVCCYVRELVHRPPSMAREAYPGCNAPLSRYLVVAPRCYCLLTHHPFFALHFRVLQTILGLERLERMTSFAAELAGLDSQLSPADSSAHLASSAGAPSAASTASVNQQAAALPAAAAGQAAAAAAAAGEAPAAEEEGSEGSSRRWTEGSGPDEPHPAQPDSLARALQQLGLAGGERPSRLAQVSPHCPAPQAAEAPGAQPVAASTPTDQGLPGAAAGPTPFFTPTGLGSATASPAKIGLWSEQQQQQQQQQQQDGDWHAAGQAMSTGVEAAEPQLAGSAGASPPVGTRRALEEVLAEVGSSGSSPAGPAGVAPAAQDAALGHPPRADAELAAPAASRSSSRAGSRQRRGEQPGEDDGSASDAESYLTASSSTALLTAQSLLDASPLPPSLSGRLSQGSRVHERTLSATSMASLGAAGASPPPAGRAGSLAAAAASGAAADAAQERGQAPAAEAPLLDLATEPPALLPADQPEQQQQELQGSCPAEPPPLLQLEEAQPEGQEEERRRQEQQHLASPPASLPLIELLGDVGPAQQQQQQQQQQVAAATGAMHHAGQDARLSAQGQQADVRAMPPPPPRQPRQQQSQQEQAQEQVQQQQGQRQQGQRQQAQQQVEQQDMPAAEEQLVVRVTARSVDLSRPLCSADLLAVYRASVVPQPGQLFEFQPDPGLQTISFTRPDLLRSIRELGLRPSAASLPDIDAAENLGGWAVAALCRAMSLENLLTFLTAALLERQIVVFCPNAGLLSGIVLSLVPLLLPFHWQCLLLPVLPAGEGRLELMEAPVPFVLGVLYKTPEVRSKCGGLVRVNVYKDKVVNAGGLPSLPQQAALADALAGSYAELRRLGLARAAATRPVHVVSDKQQAMAEGFLATLKRYLQGLVADLPAYCITDVSSTMERTSVLLKDSFVESFPPRDRPFMRQFAETQMFSVYCDAVI